MIDDFFERTKSQKIGELNVVPILDMLMSVIFFLLLSTTLIGYTKLEVPPAKISQDSKESAIPLSPKLFIKEKNNNLEFRLQWSGPKPSFVNEKLEISQNLPTLDFDKSVRELVFKMSKSFKDLYPDEQTLELGMAETVPYQILISVMDGVKTNIKDVVLISYAGFKNTEKE